MRSYLKNKKPWTRNLKNSWFTFAEIIVSITILSIIMISVMGIFVSASDVSMKANINRMMQENIKNVVETIAEDVRKNWISWVSGNITDTCGFSNNDDFYKEWTKLCTWSNNNYYLAQQNNNWDNIIVASSKCSPIEEHCFIVKNRIPLSNSSASFKDLKFYVSNESIPKVTINFTLQPAVRKWVKSSLIKENKIIFQTTISERFIKNN